MRVPVLAALALVAAGCVQAPDAADPSAAPPAIFVDPIVDEHDHGAAAEHNLSTATMELVGHTTMSEDGDPYSYIGEMDTYGNLTVVQVLGRGSMPGFVVLDTSNPAAPTPIGRAQMPYSYVVDVKWAPDGQSVFAASQAGTSRQRSDVPVTDDPANALLTGNGFTQFDMRDPTAPVAVSGGLSEPTGCHMLSVKEIAGETLVFCVANVVKVYAYAEGGAWTEVGALAPNLASEGVMRTLEEALGAGASAPNSLLLSAEPHDITIQEDPIEPGRFVASVSYWDLGLIWYDVTDPRSPQVLGAWNGGDASVYEGNVHGATLGALEGKRIAVAGPELLGQTVPALWILDLEDFAAPAILGEWRPPGEHVSNGLLLTTHQFQLAKDRIYLAYNHAGVWVLDLRAIVNGTYADDEARPDVLGYYLPHQEVELFDPEIAAVPNTWDINLRDGYVYASDRYTGFYVLRYVLDAPGDAAVTSST